MKKSFSIILAVDNKNGLGKNGVLAWNLPSDLKYFKKITTKTKNKDKINALIMGRKTWESIPKKFRPLKGRLNCILTRQDIFYNNKTNNKDIIYFKSLNYCIKDLKNNKLIENIFIIGGASLYNNALKNPILDKIYLTKINGDFNCDVFFNGIPKNFKLEKSSKIIKENDVEFKFLIYKK